MAELALRMVASLAIVVGLLLLIARFSSRRLQGKGGSLVTVLHRQSLSRASGVAVVSVGRRVLVLGTTDQQVQVLAELSPDEIETQLPGVVAALEQDAAPQEPTAPPALAAAPALPLAAAPAAPAPVPDDVATTLHAELTGSTGGHRTPTSRRAATEPGGRRARRSAGSHRAPTGAGPSHAAHAAVPTTAAGAESGALGGSVLSPQTWRQALHAVTGRAS